MPIDISLAVVVCTRRRWLCTTVNTRAPFDMDISGVLYVSTPNGSNCTMNIVCVSGTCVAFL